MAGNFHTTHDNDAKRKESRGFFFHVCSEDAGTSETPLELRGV
jgi:hypothetical protein